MQIRQNLCNICIYRLYLFIYIYLFFSEKRPEQSIASARASVMIYDDQNKKWIPAGSSLGLSKVCVSIYFYICLLSIYVFFYLHLHIYWIIYLFKIGLSKLTISLFLSICSSLYFLPSLCCFLELGPPYLKTLDIYLNGAAIFIKPPVA